MRTVTKKWGAAVKNKDDHSILLGLKENDPLVTEEFVRANFQWMRSVAWRILRDQALADDCVQEAFIKALAKLDQFEARSSLKTWMRVIVVNEALMELRSRRRSAETSIDDLMPEFDRNECRIEPVWEERPIPSDFVEAEATAELVRSRILDLPDSYRVVLQLRDIEEMSTKEVAAVLGIEESNVKVRLHRARTALKKLLEPILRGERT